MMSAGRLKELEGKVGSRWDGVKVLNAWGVRKGLDERIDESVLR